ncbi:hypothetical protein Hanom_Chr17g01581271 [Helianthus anomalus]
MFLIWSTRTLRAHRLLQLSVLQSRHIGAVYNQDVFFSSCEFKVSRTLLSALSEPNSDTIPIQQVDEMAEGRQHSENSNPPPSSKSTTASEIHNMFEKDCFLGTNKKFLVPIKNVTGCIQGCFECPADELPHHALCGYNRNTLSLRMC